MQPKQIYFSQLMKEETKDPQTVRRPSAGLGFSGPRAVLPLIVLGVKDAWLQFSIVRE